MTGSISLKQQNHLVLKKNLEPSEKKQQKKGFRSKLVQIKQSVSNNFSITSTAPKCSSLLSVNKRANCPLKMLLFSESHFMTGLLAPNLPLVRANP